MEELKPCPFCGSTNVHMSDGEKDWMQYVYCEDCNAIGPDGNTMISYAEAWNQRAERTCKNTDNKDGFTCSACGCVILEDDLSCLSGQGRLRFLLHYPHYCPNCGAKVVE